MILDWAEACSTKDVLAAVSKGSGPGTSTWPFVNWVVVVVLVLVAVGAEEELAVSKTGNHVTMSGTVKSWGWSSFREDNFRIWEEFCGFSVSRDFPPADKTVRSVASELLKMKNKKGINKKGKKGTPTVYAIKMLVAR